MIQKLIRSAVIVALLGTLVAVTPQPAQASKLCTWLGVCGKVTVKAGSPYGIVVTNDWPAQDGDTQRVAPGRSSTFRDTDGYYVPPGYVVKEHFNDRLLGFHTTPGWRKIRDHEHSVLTIQRYKRR